MLNGREGDGDLRIYNSLLEEQGSLNFSSFVNIFIGIICL